ncbi:hypothetical protein QQS21_005397 [Conoideocrella luteorostrata]|uniref:Uncharacterized protein n=1 Tax=Conoideocrella luteorostrata TaxID=1105319 RepID=A0AAJ0FZ19_9HYPO|nr:hypothetical protein QQS21_005397 [Conoideocrella luteorostrata]
MRRLFRKQANKAFRRKGAEKETGTTGPVADADKEYEAILSAAARNFPSTTTGGSEPKRTVASIVHTPTPRADDEEEDDSHGLFTFVDKSRQESDIVDIVALHGLNGHYRKTWTTTGAAGKNVNWLKDMLPQHIPNARIMSFGYDSSVQFSKSTSGINEFAEGLLADLMTCRNSNKEKERPLIFICHSLGGIVFKQALVRARERDHFTSLLRQIRGVAFFGTPHAGSTSAKFGEILATILKASTLGANTNSKLVADLKSKSETLRGISKSFVDRSKALRILSFYETEKMDFLNFQVVDQESARLNLPNEICIPISGNHVTMCKFSNSQAGLRKFRSVSNHLKNMAEELNATEVSHISSLSEPEQRECLRGFYHENYESYRNRNPDRIAGTCEWFLRHPEYRNWRTKESSGLLWVSADPGCGKSVLAKFLVEHLRKPESKQDHPELLCHFFFKDDSNEQRSSVLALRALLHQIFSDDKALLRHAFPVFESKGMAMFHDFESMWDILSSVAMDPEATSLLIVLDALDECETASQMKLLTSLNKLYNHKAVRSEKPFLKVILLSRPENNIKCSFNNSVETVRLRGEDETEAISGDVELVVRSHFDELEFQGLPRDFLSELQNSLIQRADRTFLWTTLMIRLFKDAAISGASQKELLEILENRDIYAIYSKLLERATHVDRSNKLLQLVLAAARPLSLDELNIALVVSPQLLTFTELQANLKHPMENYVKSTCGHFIRIIRSGVFLIHQSAREFLLQRLPGGEAALGTVPHSLISEECDSTLLRSCMSYLFLMVVAADREQHTNEFVDYAGTYWPQHLKDTNDEIFDEIVDVVLGESTKSPKHEHQWLLVHDVIVQIDNWRFFSTMVPCTQQLAIDQMLDRLIIRLLGDERVDVEATDSDGRALLHHASAVGSPNLVTTLVDKGLNVSALDNKNNTPLHLAFTGPQWGESSDDGAGKQRTMLYDRERKEYAQPNPPQMLSETKNGLRKSFRRRCLEGRENDNEDDSEDDSEDVNEESVLSGQQSPWVTGDIMHLLVSQGADINATNSAGDTPLHLAIECRAPKATSWLLSNGAQVNANNAKQETALHSAVDTGSASTIEEILNYNPDLSRLNCNGETAFQVLRRRPTIDYSIAGRLRDEHENVDL